MGAFNVVELVCALLDEALQGLALEVRAMEALKEGQLFLEPTVMVPPPHDLPPSTANMPSVQHGKHALIAEQCKLARGTYNYL